METITLNDVRVELSVDDLARRLHVRAETPQLAELAQLVEDAARAARPKAIGGIAYVEEHGDDYVVIDGIRFDSRVLAVNLADTGRVFPYVATSGLELDAWAEGLDDFLHRYWSEAIREAALRLAMGAMFDWVDDSYRPGQTARMNPGSLADWPIQQQLPLFRLLGDVEGSIGVHLTDGLLMVPSKSVSGILFGTGDTFESCMLCPRVECPNRRAPYDPDLYARRYGPAAAKG